ncbi:YjgP/YjgQ family permease [Neokomagataea tanensis]|uniref:YjgP/YjgQ family permease n=2 Tax=Neokomagataea TaxID=1223423 RepID=A0A4Y6V700_9PROT|nr:YjgP/YjgQ family permease [Neokomagataea tanensis]
MPQRHRAVLIRHLNKALLGRVMLCGAVLVALMELLALLEKTTPILNRHLGVRGLAIFSALHLPALSIDILPLAFLIGALFFLTQLALSSEMSALRAAGLSTIGLYRLLLPTVLFVGFAGMIGQYWVVPASEGALKQWWNATTPINEHDDSDQPLWFRMGGTLIRIEHISNSGQTLSDITRYDRDAHGQLTSTQHADSLNYAGDHWEETGNLTLQLNPDHSAAHRIPGGALALPVSPRTIIRLTQAQPFLTPGEILDALHNGAPASLPRPTYRMALFSPLILPIDMATMLLLALPVIYIPPRTGLRTPLPVYVLAAGLALVILQGLINALGNAGTLPAALAVLSGPLPGILFGITWVLRMEEK